MYKVYKVVYTGSYSGAFCALIAADDLKEAEWIMQVKFKDCHFERMPFVIEGIVSCLTSTTKGVIVSNFHIE